MALRVSEFPRAVVSRDGALEGTATGTTRRCTLAGCTGIRYFVKWPDGKWSWPCSKGLETGPDGKWRIR